MSIPFFFRTSKLTSASGLTSTLVDGGMLSNFPIDSFDRRDGRLPRWPTFGVTLLPNLPQGNDKVIPALGPVNWLFGGPPLLRSVDHHDDRRSRPGLPEPALGRLAGHPGRLVESRIPRLRYLREPRSMRSTPRATTRPPRRSCRRGTSRPTSNASADP